MKVVFEETGEEREVVGSCGICFPDPDVIGEVYLVAPDGIQHEAWEGGETDCGEDATGPDWWWRL